MAHLADERTTVNRKPCIGWDNRLYDVTLSGAAAVGFPAIAARTYQTYEGWAPTGGTGNLTATMSTSITLGYVGALFMSTPDSATVQLYIDGEPIGFGVPAQGPVMWLLDDASATVVTIEVQGMTSGFVANLSAGPRLELPSKLYVGHTPITYGRDTVRTSGLSESGQYLGTIERRRSVATGVSMSNVEPQTYRDEIDAFVAQAQIRPHYWAWRSVIPGLDVLATLSPEINVDVTTPRTEVGYVTVPNAPTVSNEKSNGMMQIGWSLAGIEQR